MRPSYLAAAVALVAAAAGLCWYAFGQRDDQGERAESDRKAVEEPVPRPVPRRKWPAPAPSPAGTNFADVLKAARGWLDKDAETGAAASKAWGAQSGPLIKLIRRDPERAREFLEYLGAAEDADAALYAARVLPFVWAAGFDARLAASAKGDGPLLSRRIALIGLRGRGPDAALAVAEVAAKAKDPTLRADATQGLAAFLLDPALARQRSTLREPVVGNLGHDAAPVRLAALRALLAERRPVDDEAVRQRLGTMAQKESDQVARAYAQRLLQRR